LAWLGPSLVLSTCPAVFGYGLHAFRRAGDRAWTWVALAVAVLEFGLWCLLLCAQPVFLGTIGLAAGVIFALKYILDHC
jgi:hypothetical protein